VTPEWISIVNKRPVRDYHKGISGINIYDVTQTRDLGLQGVVSFGVLGQANRELYMYC
jgi:hypothetical protein